MGTQRRIRWALNTIDLVLFRTRFSVSADFQPKAEKAANLSWKSGNGNYIVDVSLLEHPNPVTVIISHIEETI